MTENILLLLPIKECSKRFPRKNFINLNGIPLWQYSYKVANDFWWANNTSCKLYISSEYDGFKKEVSDHNFIHRPKELAQDPSQIVDVCLHALEYLEEKFTTLIMIQPSNPFIKQQDVQNCYNLFLDNDRRTVRSVYRFKRNFWRLADWIVEPDKNNEVGISDTRVPIITPYNPTIYVGNGSIVVIDIEKLKKEKTLASLKTIPYEMSMERSIDINDELDFKIAEILIKRRR